MARRATIRCPHCDREYLAGEIFLPKEFLGQPHNTIRGFNGDVLTYDGTDMDLKETYICDECGTKFSIEAVVNFKVEEIKELFDDEDDFAVNKE